MPNSPLIFDLELLRNGAGYRAHVLNSPGGQGSADVTLPFNDTEIENLILKMGVSQGRTRGAGDSVRTQAAKTFGGGLFRAFFKDAVAQCWTASLAKAADTRTSLQLRLRLNDAPELANLPWEFLYDPSLNRFFLLSRDTPLIRYLELPNPPPPLTITPPLNILLMISSPKGEDPLDVAGEEKLLRDALHDLVQAGSVTIKRLERPSLAGLQRELLNTEYHILHFIGHGSFDEQRGRGLIMLEDDNRYSALVDGERFATMIHDESLRLVILNSCDGARPTINDPFGGFAQRIIQQDIPAVIAMQFEISDAAAIAFSREFYAALAASFTIEAALAEARKAIYALPNDTEWGIPVLYSRAPDGILFKIETAPVTNAQPPQQIVVPVAGPPNPPPANLNNFYGAVPARPNGEFAPVGKWQIQVQDMVGSRLHVEFLQDGSFQMLQQVGMYQVPVNGSWTFNPLTKQLAMQGVVNTFQPFILAITISGKLPNGFAAVGSDGIGYVLTMSS